MKKSPDAFRSIGEVARLVGVAPHVLRYWEGQFPQLSPVKRADGRRYYRPEDVQLAAALCEVMREEGLTIRGAKRLIALDRGAALRARGAARLKETTGLDFGSDVAHPHQKNSNTAASAAAKAVSVSEHSAPTTTAVAHPAIETGNDVWILRLARVAARLRGDAVSLPASAERVAQDLRDVLSRR